MDHVVLVDQDDQDLGSMEKLQAHREGRLHRAFSVVIFNSRGEILIQKRAIDKYHSAGLWTNACCSHPMPSEEIVDAVKRRLHEELGLDLQPSFAYKFIYRTELAEKLIEHEMDYVFTAISDKEPVINKNEIADWKYISSTHLRQDIDANPDQYTHWFKLILNDPRLPKPGGWE